MDHFVTLMSLLIEASSKDQAHLLAVVYQGGGKGVIEKCDEFNGGVLTSCRSLYPLNIGPILRLCLGPGLNLNTYAGSFLGYSYFYVISSSLVSPKQLLRRGFPDIRQIHSFIQRTR